MPIHDYVKEELIAHGVNPNKIFPPHNKTKPEIKLIGFLKGKNQDIVVLPHANHEWYDFLPLPLFSSSFLTDKRYL